MGTVAAERLDAIRAREWPDGPPRQAQGSRHDVTARLRKAFESLSLAAAAAWVIAASSEATHEVYYRYLVLGYVRDSAGRPIPGSNVRVVREKTGLRYETKTEGDGFYLLIINLHDEDLGDALQVTAGPATIRIQARFDPRDAQNHRGTRVDFRGGQAEERQEMFAETLRDYLRQ